MTPASLPRRVPEILRYRLCRVVFLSGIGAVLFAGTPHAEKAAPPAEKLVTKIDSVIATRSHNHILIQAKGAVNSGGWKSVRLKAVKSPTGDSRTIVLDFVAVPPMMGQPVITGLLPVTASTTVHTRRHVVSVRTLSGSNEITTQILK